MLISVARGQYYGGYVDNRASTPMEGYARGMADVVRSKGMANLANSQAAINMTEAASKNIDNRKQWTDTYFQMRQANQQYRAQERSPKPSMEALVRFAQAGKPQSLSPSELDTVDGSISWPLLLTAPQYADYRTKLETLYAKRAKLGGVTLDDYMAINETTDAMLASLKADVKQAPPDAYITARKFIQSLAFEANRPAG